MRSILAIVVGAAMIYAPLVGFANLADAPTALKVILVLFGLVLVWAGFSHARLRYNRHRAYNGGRERQGTVRLLMPRAEDDSTAQLLFTGRSGEWIIMIDAHHIRSIEASLSEDIPARAYLGENDRIYGLDIGKLRTLPISPGYPYEGKLRSAVEGAMAKKAALLAQAAQGKAARD